MSNPEDSTAPPTTPATSPSDDLWKDVADDNAASALAERLRCVSIVQAEQDRGAAAGLSSSAPVMRILARVVAAILQG